MQSKSVPHYPPVISPSSALSPAFFPNSPDRKYFYPSMDLRMLNLFRNFASVFASKQYSDAILRVVVDTPDEKNTQPRNPDASPTDTDIYVHKVLLATLSDFFQSLFLSAPCEYVESNNLISTTTSAKQNPSGLQTGVWKVCVPSVPEFKIILEWVYTGVLSIKSCTYPDTKCACHNFDSEFKSVHGYCELQQFWRIMSISRKLVIPFLIDSVEKLAYDLIIFFVTSFVSVPGSVGVEKKERFLYESLIQAVKWNARECFLKSIVTVAVPKVGGKDRARPGLVSTSPSKRQIILSADENFLIDVYLFIKKLVIAQPRGVLKLIEIKKLFGLAHFNMWQVHVFTDVVARDKEQVVPQDMIVDYFVMCFKNSSGPSISASPKDRGSNSKLSVGYEEDIEASLPNVRFGLVQETGVPEAKNKSLIEDGKKSEKAPESAEITVKANEELSEQDRKTMGIDENDKNKTVRPIRKSPKQSRGSEELNDSGVDDIENNSQSEKPKSLRTKKSASAIVENLTDVSITAKLDGKLEDHNKTIRQKKGVEKLKKDSLKCEAIADDTKPTAVVMEEIFVDGDDKNRTIRSSQRKKAVGVTKPPTQAKPGMITVNDFVTLDDDEGSSEDDKTVINKEDVAVVDVSSDALVQTSDVSYLDDDDDDDTIDGPRVEALLAAHSNRGQNTINAQIWGASNDDDEEDDELVPVNFEAMNVAKVSAPVLPKRDTSKRHFNMNVQKGMTLPAGPLPRIYGDRRQEMEKWKAERRNDRKHVGKKSSQEMRWLEVNPANEEHSVPPPVPKKDQIPPNPPMRDDLLKAKKRSALPAKSDVDLKSMTVPQKLRNSISDGDFEIRKSLERHRFEDISKVATTSSVTAANATEDEAGAAKVLGESVKIKSNTVTAGAIDGGLSSNKNAEEGKENSNPVPKNIEALKRMSISSTNSSMCSSSVDACSSSSIKQIETSSSSLGDSVSATFFGTTGRKKSFGPKSKTWVNGINGLKVRQKASIESMDKREGSVSEISFEEKNGGRAMENLKEFVWGVGELAKNVTEKTKYGTEKLKKKFVK